jgi:hypothetical protein
MQAPKRIVRPTAKRAPAARPRPLIENEDELRQALPLPQPPERGASSSEQVAVPPVESLYTLQSEDDLHPAQTTPHEENKPSLIHPIGTNTSSKPDTQSATPVQLSMKLLGQSVQPAQSAQSTDASEPLARPSLWIPGTLRLSLPSTPKTSVQEQSATIATEHPHIPASNPLRGHDPVPVPPLPPVEPLRWEIEPSSLYIDDFHPPGAESIAATSKAAEHWRSSWLNRQQAEASPARGVSRGQASVAEPLLAMQQTLLQVQAALLPASRSRPRPQGMDFGFWGTMILMLILLGGLGGYSISTYLPGTQFASQLIPSIDGPQPTLTLVGINSATVTAGQTLHLHGEQFGVNDAITFVLETTTLGSSVQSTLQGTFDASITIPSNWLAGAYALEAEDNHTGKHAFLDIQVLPGTISTASTALSLEDARGNALTSLVFTSVVSQGDPQKQPIYLKNTSDMPLSWSVTAIADKNLGWLLVDDGTTSGTLKAREATSVTISVITAGLKIGSYAGHAILTVTSQGQVILPITLTVVDTTVEVVVTPNPVIAIIQPGGTCQPLPFTLINLSNTAAIRWDVKGDDPYNQQHISLNGGFEAQGSLSPSSQEENTVVLKITCSGVQPGAVYKITVYYNDIQVHVPIIMRQSY